MSKDDSLRDLIERVEKASEGSRELDDDISFALCSLGCSFPAGHAYNRITGARTAIAARHYTTSIDAVLTLIDPADEWELSTLYSIARATVGLNRDHQTTWPGYGEHKGGDPVLALLSASLRAHMGTSMPSETTK